MRKLITLGAAGIVAGLVPVGVALAATNPAPHHAAAQHVTATAPVASAPTTTAVAPTPAATTAPAQPSAPSVPVQSPAPVTASAPAVAPAPAVTPAPAPSATLTETQPYVWATTVKPGTNPPSGPQPSVPQASLPSNQQPRTVTGCSTTWQATTPTTGAVITTNGQPETGSANGTCTEVDAVAALHHVPVTQFSSIVDAATNG